MSSAGETPGVAHVVEHPPRVLAKQRYELQQQLVIATHTREKRLFVDAVAGELWIFGASL